MASRDPPATRDDLIKPYYRATQAMLRLVLDLDCQIHRRFRRFDVERDAAQTRMRQLARDLGRTVALLPAGAHG